MSRWSVIAGDCLDVLKGMPDGSVDAVVTDPPWKASGGTRVHNRAGTSTFGVAKCHNTSTSLRYGSIGKFSVEVIRECVRVSAADVLVLCGYMEVAEVIQSIGTLRGVFCWHNTKPVPIPGPVAARDAAFVVWGGNASNVGNDRRWRSCVFRHSGLPAGCMATEGVLNPDGTTAHPAQEPLSLFREIVDPLPTDAIVLDPYCGSGTTGVACMLTGRRFIGIEIDPGYADIARRRIAEAASTLWTPPEPATPDAELFGEPA